MYNGLKFIFHLLYTSRCWFVYGVGVRILRKFVSFIRNQSRCLVDLLRFWPGYEYNTTDFQKSRIVFEYTYFLSIWKFRNLTFNMIYCFKKKTQTRNIASVPTKNPSHRGCRNYRPYGKYFLGAKPPQLKYKVFGRTSRKYWNEIQNNRTIVEILKNVMEKRLKKKLTFFSKLERYEKEKRKNLTKSITQIVYKKKILKKIYFWNNILIIKLRDFR